MTVFLSTTDPTGDAEELLADPVFLIRGPVDPVSGKVIYYLTRAVEAYAVPVPVPDDGAPTIAEYFDGLPAGSVFLAAKLEGDDQEGRSRIGTTAHAKHPQDN